MVCASIAVLGGCAERKVHAFPWATAIQVKPLPPVVHAGSSSSDAAIAPDLRVEQPATLGRIVGARTGPLRPRVAPTPQPETPQATRTPLLVPEMSAEEMAAAQQQVSENLGIVEKNLVIARGRTMNAVQADLVSKVNSFVAESRESSRDGDWARARNLTKKAQLLSEELVASF